ncbi:MAG: ABC transporter permease subunit [Sandaracinaceae bacterium]|nr:ABC transporter permease subunit [Sandaracinaceae bacterium]MDW8245275.1 ABC transporter permease subunit [Sandaracinaceae bacterium]
MKAAWIIAKREILSFFLSPLAYVVLTAWTLWQGATYAIFCYYVAGSPVGSGVENDPLAMLFGQTTLFYIPLLVFVPLITMRLLAEETRQGTLETLLTAPVTSVQVVMGKYLAALVFWLSLWVPTLMYVWLTSRFGDLDAGRLLASYLGILGVGAYYMSLGLLMSALARAPMSAAILTFLALASLFALGIVQFLPVSEAALEVVRYVSVWQHMQNFSSGVVDSRYLVYDLSLSVFGLFGAVQVLEARRTHP